MVRKGLGIVAIAAAAFVAAPAMANGNGNGGSEQVIHFSDVALDADGVSPDIDRIGSRKRAEFDSLIEVRQHFLDELGTSVDSL